MIRTTTNDSKRDADMEKEVKNTLRELKATKESLADAESALKAVEKSSREKIERLEMRIQGFEEGKAYVAMLKEGAEKKEAESERLRLEKSELQREIEQKNQEMIAFNKNRDETMHRYEVLVKQLQEELDRCKREVRNQRTVF